MKTVDGNPECTKCHGKGDVLIEERILSPFGDEQESFKFQMFGRCSCVSDKPKSPSKPRAKSQGERRTANG